MSGCRCKTRIAPVDERSQLTAQIAPRPIEQSSYNPGSPPSTRGSSLYVQIFVDTLEQKVHTNRLSDGVGDCR
ncbi:MAG: hypothetical protein Kow0074_01670 [Candidatus Zixiibacteriota bacterium]